jgi:hypothetical protein
MPLSLTRPPEGNDRALAAWRQERLTGLTTATVTLSQNVDVASGICLVFKNGTLLDPTTVTPSGKTLTLSGALVAGDIVVVLYHARI